MPHTPKQWFLLGITVIAIGFVGALIGIHIESKKIPPAPTEVRENSLSYEYINPLLFERTSKEFYADEFKPLVDSLTSYIKDAESDNEPSDISVYFRDLNSGDWTGVNENDTYEPASMLKVVVMMAILKTEQTNPSLGSKLLFYTNSDDSGQNYKPTDNLTPGMYDVDTLMKAMIIDSDNGAAAALLSNSTIADAFQTAYTAFRLPSIPTATTTDYMSARSYSAVFRSLYNSTYLSDQSSERALNLLSQTTFNKGIVAGLPLNTVSSHKFGEYEHTLPDGTLDIPELHDCGIVYYPAHPYLICIMAKGDDFPSLEQALSGVSKIIYNYVATKNKS